MTSSVLKALTVAVLGVLLALGMTLSVAQPGSMSVAAVDSMTMPSMHVLGMPVCPDCQAGEEMAAQCLAVCAMPAFALCPDAGFITIRTLTGRQPLPRFAFPPGRAEPPTPLPPRTTYIG